MNIQIPVGLLPSLLFVMLCFVFANAILWIFRKQTAKKKSPLNIDLMRRPGESLIEQIEDLSGEIIFYVLFIPTFSLLAYAVATTQFIAAEGEFSRGQMVVYLIAFLGAIIYCSQKVLKLMKRRNHLRLGYDCELAVGQELNNRVRDGFHLFHDFPADGFNIDHVLVGPTGVFAIETKGRAKQRIAQNENWKLEFDGKKLLFPDRTETKPITQAKSQANWLSGWLRKATGEEFKVEPVLVIPGWYINKTAPSNFKLYNGKNSAFLAKGSEELSPKQIQVIAHQIEQKCRTVKSASYKQGEG